MRCTNKFLRRVICVTSCISLMCGTCACSGSSYSLPYSINSTDYSESGGEMLDTFASDLCVVNTDIGDSLTVSEKTCLGLFDLGKKETMYAINAHTQLDPASLTKVMTAIVALKNASLDQVLVADSDVYVNEAGAQMINLSAGDSMTLEQALHILLLYSANDVALLIAKNIGGSVDEFVNMMNEEALSIGATNTHFMNPNGLTAENHYTTVYDMYLMFNEALKYDKFSQIIRMSTYTTQYHLASGDMKELTVNNTNGYLRGSYEMPAGITVLGGKTGTTAAAGHCLIQLAADTSGNEYIAVIMRSEDTETLYTEMSSLLSEITK